MLSTEKIRAAFEAICEELEKIDTKDLSEEIQGRLQTVRSIAKHQSDIRAANDGSCSSSHTKCS